MKNTLTKVTALLLGVDILLTGQGLLGTLIPTRAALEGFSAITIGIISASYFLGFTSGCLRGSVFSIYVFITLTMTEQALSIWPCQ